VKHLNELILIGWIVAIILLLGFGGQVANYFTGVV